MAAQRLRGVVRPLPHAWAHDPCPQIPPGLLHFYKIKLQHLNPNGIQHMAVFIMLCKGFLGISPHFDLWRYFFTVNL